MKTPMTPTAQEVVEKSSKVAGELMTLLAFKKDSATVEDFCDVITKHLTTFAHARERAVWERLKGVGLTELGYCLHPSRAYGEVCCGRRVLEAQEKYRNRHATHAEGKDVSDV